MESGVSFVHISAIRQPSVESRNGSFSYRQGQQVSERNDVDAVIIGGGVGGSTLATVLARQGYSVALVEREPVFRDRVRGEGLHPWGYRQAVALGVDDILDDARANPLPTWQSYRDQLPEEPSRWDADPENEYPEFSVSHPALQKHAIAAAEAAGVQIHRPMSARRVERIGERWDVTLEAPDGVRRTVTGALLVGADGRDSAVRRWLGVKVTTDPVHHRFGGMLIDGFGLSADAVHSATLGNGTAYVMPQGQGRARIYAGGQAELLGPIAADRSGRRLIDLLAANLPAGAMSDARSSGPMAFFPNADIVPDRVAADGWALIGDAAGANDPSVGHGLSLTYRDIRRLSELLREGGTANEALEQYAAERTAYHATVREHAKWIASFTMESGAEADERRSGFYRAKDADPTHGGFAFIYTRGPMRLVADEQARRHFFDIR
jgi:2-polyprenyl-6-methoxyphenol hydroxylase-like FAD-dependent oxidoreductase